MTRLVAAIDNSAAAQPVLRIARTMARLFEADPEALHVAEDHGRNARGAAAAAGIPLREVTGDVVTQLVAVAGEPDVVALVVGSRGRPAGTRPAGHVALELMARVNKPLVVVPPHAHPPDRVRRLLVPLDGTTETALALEPVLELAVHDEIEIVVLHVDDETSIPSFSDQPQHETPAFAEEFIARYCDCARDDARLELRVGVPAEQVLEVTAGLGADLVALGWSQRLDSSHANVVRRFVEQAAVPVILMPLRGAAGPTMRPAS